MPCSTHFVQQGTEACLQSGSPDCLSTALTVNTAQWGDIFGIGAVSFTDIGAMVRSFKGIPMAPDDPNAGPNKWRSMLRGNSAPFTLPTIHITFTDIGKAVDAFKEIGYAENGPTACP